jgi:hypothetical protein
VPTRSAAALICDTGGLIDYLVETALDHGLFRKAIDQARTRYVPGLVLAEVDYFLRDERQGIAAVHIGSRAWRWPSCWASVDWRHATCVTSPLFDSVMVVPSISSFIPADLDKS